MKKILLLLITITALLFGSSWNCNGQICRGTVLGELYILSGWYFNPQIYTYQNAIIRSVDNGSTISIQDSLFTYNYGGYILLSDSGAGIIYIILPLYDSIRISYDNGLSWQSIVSSPYSSSVVSGCVEGEIYKRSDDNLNPGLFRSNDSGNSFVNVNPTFINPLLDVGIVPGEVYGFTWGQTGQLWDTIELNYSNNYGSSFSSILIDTSIITTNMMGPPVLSRGTEPGEFYLMRQDFTGQYHIFHTLNYGLSFELQSILPYYPDIYWDIHFTAGREPGSFYVMRTELDTISESWVILCIDYSQDYGQTFTTYCHNLIPGYTGINEKFNEPKGEFSQNYPNPFNSKTSFNFSTWERSRVFISILNINGKKVKTLIDNYMEKGTHVVNWDGRDETGNKLPSGIYIYNLQVNGLPAGIKRMVLINQ